MQLIYLRSVQFLKGSGQGRFTAPPVCPFELKKRYPDALPFYFFSCFLYSDGEKPFCFLKILLKYSGLSYPTKFPISVTL